MKESSKVVSCYESHDIRSAYANCGTRNVNVHLRIRYTALCNVTLYFSGYYFDFLAFLM